MDGKTMKNIKELLSEANLKNTKGRVSVLSVLSDAHRPLTIEEVSNRLKEKVHFVTLYRMFKQFVDSEIVYQTDLRKGKVYYELQQEHHHHIICTQCERQEEITSCLKLIEEYALKNSLHFRTIQSHALEFFSVCNTCSSIK